ncbi:unnamed protein product [Schistosoma mattheei]|uniref:Uncharacterized protein n=1 Tax=Schistosoma mattheei TaxID=31246 RepID=A0A3P8GKH9_9TREM|nr:unnamed protein product [Schistosoma mattheei]
MKYWFNTITYSKFINDFLSYWIEIHSPCFITLRR